jgi:hypothetical protein
MRGLIPLFFASLCLAQDPGAVPLSDRLNVALPYWLRFGGEVRVRYEGFTGNGFRPSADDDHVLTRLRLNMLVRPVSRLSFVLQAQDARVFGTRQRPVPTSYEDTVDLRIAYVELGNAEKDPVAIRAGRQELNFGEQRMIGYNGWRNTAQSFDAIRLMLRHGGLGLNVFASSPIIIQDRFGRRVPGNNIHGLYGSAKDARRQVTVEPYVLWRLSPSWRVEAGGFGRLDVKYPGVHVFGKAGQSFDYDSELALEMGHSGPDRIRAWAGHWRAGYRAGLPHVPAHWIAEYNYASGDRNPRDGMQGGFTAPYPSNHDRYGLADQIGWKNIHHVRTGAEFQVSPKWQVIPNLHNYWLASRTDGLFTPANLQLARIEKGARSNRVGWEADISAVWTISSLLQAGAGFTRLFPGAFLKEATPGVSYNFAYCFVAYRF